MSSSNGVFGILRQARLEVANYLDGVSRVRNWLRLT